jgi:hypothetical protein
MTARKAQPVTDQGVGGDAAVRLAIQGRSWLLSRQVVEHSVFAAATVYGFAGGLLSPDGEDDPVAVGAQAGDPEGSITAAHSTAPHRLQRSINHCISLGDARKLGGVDLGGLLWGGDELGACEASLF